MFMFLNETIVSWQCQAVLTRTVYAFGLERNVVMVAADPAQHWAVRLRRARAGALRVSLVRPVTIDTTHYYDGAVEASSFLCYLLRSFKSQSMTAEGSGSPVPWRRAASGGRVSP